MTPNDPGYGEMWGLHNWGQTGGTLDTDIDAPEAWDITTGDGDIVVAVIDSGIDLNHPDLSANIWTNPGEIPGNGIDDDGNGYIDDVHGWDFSSNDNNPSDDIGVCGGHGTHTSGTIGAVGDNGIGVTGINWDVKIMPLKTAKQILIFFCGLEDADIIKAIEYAAMNGARVSNNSYGGGFYNQAVFNTIRASKHLFVAAAGNESNNNDVNPSYPASYDLDNIISVAATDHNDSLLPFPTTVPPRWIWVPLVSIS
jgi:subtilisin family serine protease